MDETADERSSSRTVQLYAIEGLAVWAELRADGALLLHGQDLSPGDIFPGAEEYEWIDTVRPEQVPLLVEALGEPAGTPVLEALDRGRELIRARGTGAFLTENGIEADAWTSLH